MKITTFSVQSYTYGLRRISAWWRKVAEGYDSVSLWVLTGNDRAVRFYERAGLVIESQVRKSFNVGGIAVEELRYVRDVG